MDLTALGVPTCHTRVERWESDFNDHWNTRFYSRTFQMAAEVVAERSGQPDGGRPAIRHVRYHGERRVGDPIRVRSARVEGGDQSGAVVHLMFSGADLAATALDLPVAGASSLPSVPAEAVRMAIPRGITGMPDQSAGPGEVYELGPVWPCDLDHRGGLLAEFVTSRSAVATTFLLETIGFTPDLTRKTGIGRMAVETRESRLGDCAAGTCVLARSRLVGVSRKSFQLAHLLFTRDGRPLARVEHNLLTVDLALRKAVDVPEMFRNALA